MKSISKQIKNNKGFKANIAGGTMAAILTLSLTSPAAAEFTPYYSHDGSSTSHPDWMGSVPDSRRLSDLSIPGTHDTMTYGISSSNWSVNTQVLSLIQQLDSGIRYVDARLRYIDEKTFALHHGDVYLNAMFGDMIRDIKAFLQAHPKEAVLMRVKQEKSTVSDAEFNTAFQSYIDRNPDLFWDSKNRSITDPTLDEIRGKIVPLYDVGGSSTGLSYSSQDIQDDYYISSNYALYDKWEKVHHQLNNANNNSGKGKLYLNYLSANGGSFPYFVASGHTSPENDAPQFNAGVHLESTWPEWPHYACVPLIGCTVYSQGTNKMIGNYLGGNITRAGIVISDFPGPGLIDKIVNLNQ